MNLRKLLALLLLTGPGLMAQRPADQLDSLLQQFYKADEPGAAVAVVQKGKLVFEKCYGLANVPDNSPITPTTNFNIASITKQFTALAILQLAEKQKLALDDRLSKYFPQLNPSVGNRITIRHLLMHSSGVKDHYPYVDTKTIRHATDNDVLKAVEKTDSLYFTPGAGYRYSNTAYCLLSLIIEKTSGLAYTEYLHQNIFQPLGMSASTVLNIGKTIHNRATGYTYDASKKQFRQSDVDESVFFSTQGDGGIYTSLRDYVKWFRALQQGKLLGRKNIHQARQIQNLIDSAHQLGYGYGWFAGAKEKPAVVFHTGSNGGFRAIVVTIPAKDYAVIIFSNRTGVDLEKLAEEINRIFHQENKSFQSIESLISFNDSWPIFAPCKKIPWYLILSTKNWNARETV